MACVHSLRFSFELLLLLLFYYFSFSLFLACPRAHMFLASFLSLVPIGKMLVNCIAFSRLKMFNSIFRLYMDFRCELCMPCTAAYASLCVSEFKSIFFSASA